MATPEASAGVRVSFPGAPGEAPEHVVVQGTGDGRATLNGEAVVASVGSAGPSRFRLDTAERSRLALILPAPKLGPISGGPTRVEVVIDGWRFELDLELEARARLRERATSARAGKGAGGPLELRAIIPGRIVSIDVAAGDVIDAGGRLLVVEAMKMQNELRSPRGGTISRVAVGPGQTVERGDVLLVLE
jgi:multidrug efflux pump subunit AcrA (membrane-fusion protein)